MLTNSDINFERREESIKNVREIASARVTYNIGILKFLSDPNRDEDEVKRFFKQVVLADLSKIKTENHKDAEKMII